MGLGALADVPLVKARAEADRVRVEVRSGVDPVAARRAARASAARASAAAAAKRTFRQAAENYVEAHSAAWKHHDARRTWFNPIVKYAFPVIGGMMLDDIRVEHVAAIMAACEQGGAPKVAPRVRLRVEQIINAATVKSWRDAALKNPASIEFIKAVRPTTDKGADEHFRRLALDDAPATFRKLRALAAGSTVFSAWVWVIATAARPGEEGLKAQWNEIDLDKKLWTVPAERMKGGKPHVVPLSALALEVLDRQRSVRTGDALFPGRNGSPISYSRFATAPAKAGLDCGSPHSWRSIFRDACGDRLRVDRDLAEAALGHSLGKVEAAYRRETAVEQRRAVMEAYAAWLMDESANVIEFKSRA
jgi:integrase